MTTLEEKFSNYKENHSLSDEAMQQLLVIFNESFIELAHKLLNTKDETPTKSKKDKTPDKKRENKDKKWATKIAQEYAEDNNLTLDDFDMSCKITKKHIDDFIKIKNAPNIKKIDSNQREKSGVVKCAGLTNKGCPCGKPGTEKPNGSSNMYCFRHATEWQNFEVSSDSELEEEEFIK